MLRPRPTLDPGADLPRYRRGLVWFRRDLRDDDHAALYYALKHCDAVHCVFVFDRDILDRLADKADRRVEFIHASVGELQGRLYEAGGDLVVRHASAREAVPQLAVERAVDAVFVNEDYEPEAIARDDHVARALRGRGIAFHAFKDQVIFARHEVLTKQAQPFSVFTPYKRAWLDKLTPFYRKPYPVDRHRGRLAREAVREALPSLADLGFEKTGLARLGIPTGMSGAQRLLEDFLPRMNRYRTARDFPAVKGVSYLSVHNRFGTVSIRTLVNRALASHSEGGETWLSELIWRDFYFQVLVHHPHVAKGAFQREYDAIAWPNDAALFAAWCEGRTGFPIVDAAMRQLNTTGYMHNRLRMIAASFLIKDLLVDWRWGEAYFARHLNDFDLAANNGGWQWAASTGCDAAPYFRIFNPMLQSQKFDPSGKFIRRYVPELARLPDKFLHAPWTMPAAALEAVGVVLGRDYPAPVVEHGVQRDKALALYKAARGGGGE